MYRFRQATSKDIVADATVYIEGDDGDLHKKVIEEVLRPSDEFKAFSADDGCRYGLDGCYIKELATEDGQSFITFNGLAISEDDLTARIRTEITKALKERDNRLRLSAAH